MEYESIKETATRWGVSLTRVRKLCQDGRVKGAKKLGKLSWMLPKGSANPAGKCGPVPKPKEADKYREGYDPVGEVAARWGCTTARVCQLCRDGRIAGAVQVNGFIWYVPAGADKPSRYSRNHSSISPSTSV